MLSRLSLPSAPQRGAKQAYSSLKHRMAAPVASPSWTPPAGQGVTAVQAGPSFVSQPYSGITTSARMEALQQQLQQPQVPQQSQQETTGFTVHYDMSATDSDSGSDSGPLRVPLKLVVQDAVKRWFNETLSEARRGDVKQQALLAQMLAEGYGCKQDLEESRRWAERARCRGYQMSGVYCEL